MKMLPTVQET